DRPVGWRTLELPYGLGAGIRKSLGNASVVVIDCLTLLVSNLVCREGGVGGVVNRVRREIDSLLECIDSVPAAFIIVSNEVGLGLVPENKLGRLYRDLLGEVNRLMAGRADEVLLMVAGIPVKVKSRKG
ncbi:MAG: bifunctional adenosylcobinamide kinase/adenosylcobinamide-phosphate guanylyltransferase, partial [Dehalococcoidia bacterium]|nr:bifunctional adenosylcobinamide kinase/adenosylcobinamide-phosphate guanylyltransferase [Dehalococcoidia bacterium]